MSELKSPTSDLELAAIGNCQIAALLDPCARLVWLCLPRPDGDPIFNALLTRVAGSARDGAFALELERLARSEQRYERNTAIVETCLEDDQGGVVKITDFCPRYRARGRMFRPAMLIRIVEPLSGRPLLRCRLRPMRNYGAAPLEAQAGSHHLRFDTGNLRFRVTTDASITALMESKPMPLERPLVFVLGPDDALETTPSVLARNMLDETRSYWLDWVRSLAVPFEWQSEVIRAAIALKLCTYEDTGAVLAALTTSIPESPDSGRTWDYRFCWLRDSYFVIRALNRLGATRTMEAYLNFMDRLITRENIDALQPVYGLSGEPELTERIVETLDGFAGMGPVRAGNQAAAQQQHDVYGSLILAVTQSFFDERLVRSGDRHLFERLERLGRRAAANFRRPDAGPWEFRGTARIHTFSAAMSWAGCDRLARIATRLDLADQANTWRRHATQMRTEILEHAWSERRRAFVGAEGTDDLDSSALLFAELGLVAPDDPRFLQTLDAIGANLRDGSLLYRYRHADDFGLPATAFTVCAFWYVDALALAGRRAEAREHFATLLRYRNAVGLLSEDIDPRSGQLWGNYPQTYSLVGLINSALRLSEPWESAL